jgi:hypothetical protein
VSRSPQQGSAIGSFFRRLADWFDRSGEHKPSRNAGTRSEVELFASLLLLAGILTASTLINGVKLLPLNFLFAGLFSLTVFIIFRSSRWDNTRRGFLLILLLLLSLVTISERVMALALFIGLFFLLIRGLWGSGDFLRRDTLSVVATLLTCYSAYAGYSAILESNRNSHMVIGDTLTIKCDSIAKGRTTCHASEADFDLPDYWQPGSRGVFIDDLRAIANLERYRDSATDNTIGFAAFSSSPATIMQSIANFLYVQKGFLRSHGLHNETLVPQQLMKSADTELYNLTYEAPGYPGYLGTQTEYHALILLHHVRKTTWLFIIDGADVSDREFTLHRIISGFR